MAVWLVKPPISLAMKHKCKLALLIIPLVSVSFLSGGKTIIKMELNSEFDRLEAEVNRLMKYDEIQQELERAEKKHPDFPKDMFQQLAIMQEEAGEVTKAVLHYHYEGGTLEDVCEELVQTAAMCMRMLGALANER